MNILIYCRNRRSEREICSHRQFHPNSPSLFTLNVYHVGIIYCRDHCSTQWDCFSIKSQSSVVMLLQQLHSFSTKQTLCDQSTIFHHALFWKKHLWEKAKFVVLELCANFSGLTVYMFDDLKYKMLRLLICYVQSSSGLPL